jgi:TolA-binding protein
VLVLTGRRITIAVFLSIALVFALAGWRYFNGEAEKPSLAKSAAPVAKPLAPTVVAETSASLNQVEMTQQVLVDDVQVMQGRVSKQEAEIKRLKAELEALSQRYETLMSFASTPKEAKPAPALQPPKKKKKRVVRLSKKR